MLGDEKFNLLFQELENNNSLDSNDNIMLQIHKQITQATTEEEIMSVYDTIYQLYENKMQKDLSRNENIEYLFNRYSEQILQLQDNALLDKTNNKYLPSLERIISLYQERAIAFENVMQEKVETDIRQRIQETGKPKEVVGFVHYKILNMLKDNLHLKIDSIESKRNEQMEDTLTISTQDLGKETLEEQEDTFAKRESSNEIQKQKVAIRETRDTNTQTIS